MHVIVDQATLKAAIAACKPAVAGRSPLTVLQNVLLRTEGDSDGHRLVIQATDLDIGITRTIPARIEAPGAVTIPAKLLSDVVGGLPGGDVVLTLDTTTQTLGITCARFSSNIKGIEESDFPAIHQGAATALTLSGNALDTIATTVAFAAASDESRPVLMGVLLIAEPGRVTAVTADGFRLARWTAATETGVVKRQSYIIPADAIQDAAALFNDAGQVEVAPYFADGLEFRCANARLYTRRIDGKFPDFERIIPPEYKTRTLVDRVALVKALKLTQNFAHQNIVRLVIHAPASDDTGKIVLSANDQTGDTTSEVEAVVHGDGGQIALNVTYTLECLNAWKCEQVAMETQAPDKPGVFRPIGQEDEHIHVIMPMTIREMM